MTHNDDSFEIDPIIYATIPQYIVTNYNDISAIADNGCFYPLAYCDAYSTIGCETDKLNIL